MINYPELKLKPREDKRLRQGHLWVFSNEIDTAQTPLSQFVPGQIVKLMAASNKTIGLAYVNPHSLIAARLLTHEYNESINSGFFIKRLQQAYYMRQQLFNRPFYRLVHGESDFLPGVIIDRYGDYAVIQINTAGMELQINLLVNALEAVTGIKHILLRNDSHARELEKLPSYCEVIRGHIPELITVEENNVSFQVSLLTGQKTGWFFDHRNNRLQATHYTANKRVLDVFSYVGSWGLQTLVNGSAQQVVFVDSSEAACNQLQLNAEQLGVATRTHIINENTFAALKQLAQANEKFDVIILDPPAFIKKRKDYHQGKQAYLNLQRLALALLGPQGFLISASCSYHLEANELQQLVQQALLTHNRSAQIIYQGSQAADHPIHPMIPETAYLKCFALFVK